MGINESVSEKVLVGLPLVKQTYRVISRIGAAGKGGGLFKVVDPKIKKLYILKCVPIDPDKSKKNISFTEIRKLSASLEREKKALQSLDNEMVIRYCDSFVLDDSPDKIRKKNKCRHHCILMEYCYGSTLRNVFRKKLKEKNEKDKEESKFAKPSSRSAMDVYDNKKENKSPFRRDVTLYWFVKILETLEIIHKNHNVSIHGDIRPDNVKVCYYPSKPPPSHKKVRIKLTGFGSPISNESETFEDIEQQFKDHSGNFVYIAPERLDPKIKDYDGKLDMWSLGIIFLQLFAGITSDDIVKYIFQIFDKIKTTTELRKQFCAYFPKKYRTLDTSKIDLIDLLIFMYSEELFSSSIIEEFVKDDDGVREVLSHMICSDVGKRFSSTQLMGHRCVQTWKFLLTDDVFLEVHKGRLKFDVLNGRGGPPLSPPPKPSTLSKVAKGTGLNFMLTVSGGGGLLSELGAMSSMIPVDDDDEDEDGDGFVVVDKQQITEEMLSEEKKFIRRIESLKNTSIRLDLLGLLSVMKFDQVKNNKIFSRCLETLKRMFFVPLTPSSITSGNEQQQFDNFDCYDSYEIFLEKGGFQIIFERFRTMMKNSIPRLQMKYLNTIVHILVNFCCEMKPVTEEEKFEKIMKEICVLFRSFGCLQVLKKQLFSQDVVDVALAQKTTGSVPPSRQLPPRIDPTTEGKKEDDDDDDEKVMFFFLYMISRFSQTIRCRLCNKDMLEKLVLKVRSSSNTYIKTLFHLLVKHMGVPELQYMLDNYSYNDVSFFKKNRHRGFMFEKVIQRMFSRIREIYTLSSVSVSSNPVIPDKPKKGGKRKLSIDDDDDDGENGSLGKENEEEDEIIECLTNIIYHAQEFDSSYHIHPLKLLFCNKLIPWETRMEISRSNVDDWKQLDIQPLHISCNSKDRTKLIEVLSQKPLLSYSFGRHRGNNVEEETCIGYYEIDVENGGFTDDLYFGFRILKGGNPCSFLLHATTGMVAMVDYSRKSVKQKKINPPIYCETDSTIGCGITNKSRIFFTKDNKIHEPFIDVSSSIANSGRTPISVSIKFNGNFEFKGILNFGRLPFKFKFSEVKPEIQLSKEERKIRRRMKKKMIIRHKGVNGEALKAISEADPGGLLRRKLEDRYRDRNDFIPLLCSKLERLGKYFKDHDVDEDLQEIYDDEESLFEKIDSEFEASRGLFKKEDSIITKSLRNVNNDDDINNNFITKKKMKNLSIFNKYKNLNLTGIIRVWNVLGKKIEFSKLYDEKRGVIVEICKKMKKLHSEGIVHKDLKLETIKINMEGKVELKIQNRKERIRKLSISTRMTSKKYVPELISKKRSNPMFENFETNVYDFGLLIYCILWGVYDPYKPRLNSYCSCGKEISSQKDIEHHILKCNLKPFLDESHLVKYPKYMLQVVKDCWNTDPFVRPSFNDVYSRFEIFGDAKEDDCIFFKIIFEIPPKPSSSPSSQQQQHNSSIIIKNQILYIHLSDFSFKFLKAWLENKFKGSRVTELKHNSEIGKIRSDSDIEKILTKIKTMNLNNEIKFTVEFDRISEKLKRHFEKYSVDAPHIDGGHTKAGKKRKLEEEMEEETEGEGEEDNLSKEEIAELIRKKLLFLQKKTISKEESMKFRMSITSLMKRQKEK